MIRSHPLVPLDKTFYDRPPEIVAREMLGKALMRQRNGHIWGGIIIETEAYLAEGDLACHAARGPNNKNRCMFGPPGRLYVYSIHAKYCLNAVTEPIGRGSAVLIRAIEPFWGLTHFESHRPLTPPRDWCRGPARLCQALHVTREDNGVDLTVPQDVWCTTIDELPDFTIKISSRIGIQLDSHLPLRFFVDGHPGVSGLVRDHTARPTPGYSLAPRM